MGELNHNGCVDDFLVRIFAELSREKNQNRTHALTACFNEVAGGHLGDRVGVLGCF